MRKCLKINAVLLLILSLVACSGGKSTKVVADSADPVDPVISTPSAAGTQLEKAKVALATGKVLEARALYTEIVDGTTTSDNETATGKAALIDYSQEEARIGRAICDLLLLPQASTATKILASFGQSPWDVEATVFDDETGFLARSWVNNAPQSDFFEFHDLPFGSMGECWGNHSYKCIVSRTVNPYKTETFLNSLLELGEGNLRQIAEDLTYAYRNPAISFVIPRDLFNGDRDINLSHADITQLLSGVHAMLAGIDFANSYHFDIDLSSLVDAQGRALVTSATMVNLLNQQFALRAHNRLTEARRNLRSALMYSSFALQEVLNGANTGTLVMNATNAHIYNDLANGAAAALNSFDAPTPLAGVLPSVTVNLKGFFLDPFNGSDIQADPFVLEDGHITAVEAYWQAAINTALGGCNVGDCGRVFSAASRSVVDPFVEVFAPLEAMRIGKWRTLTR